MESRVSNSPTTQPLKRRDTYRRELVALSELDRGHGTGISSPYELATSRLLYDGTGEALHLQIVLNLESCARDLDSGLTSDRIIIIKF